MKGRKQHCSTFTRKALASPVGNSQLDDPLKLFTLRQGDWWVFISLLPPIPVLTRHLDVQHLLFPYPRHNLGQGSSLWLRAVLQGVRDESLQLGASG